MEYSTINSIQRWNANTSSQFSSAWDQRFRRSQVNSYEKLTTSRSTRLMLDVQHYSTQCIATDDPRLKEE